MTWLGRQGCRVGSIVALTFLVCETARAEVCDKERPLRLPKDGPVGPLDALLPVATSPPAIALAGLLIAAMLSGWRLAYALSAGLAIAMMLQLARYGLDPIKASAAREGCMYPQWLNLSLLGAVAIWSIWRFRRLDKSKALSSST